MIVDSTQRWFRGRDWYRPAGEPIATHRYEVTPMPGDAEAKAFVLEHHYSGSYPAARFRFGMYCGAELVGVAVFSVPMNARVLADLPGEPSESVELGRLVLLDGVPANGETWFLGRCFALLRSEGLVGVVSFSDPTPRHTVAGNVVHPGHVGTIYQAHNAVYCGHASRRTLRLLPDGTVFGNRTHQKLRARERGWRYAADLLIRHGAPEPDGDLRAWASEWVPRLTRPLPHPGNLKYLWALHRRDRKHLPESLPYPKLADFSTRRAA